MGNYPKSARHTARKPMDFGTKRKRPTKKENEIRITKAQVELANAFKNKDIGKLEKLTKSPFYKIRANAITALADLDSKTSSAEIIKKLMDKHKNVRIAAARATAKIMGRNAIEILEKRLSREEREEVKKEINLILAHLKKK